MHGARPEIFSVGHSTHELSRFLALLGAGGVGAVADVRRYPGSRRNPQFSQESLAASLDGAGLGYEWLGEELGGRRRVVAGSPNGGWKVEGFRAYADHLASEEFARGLQRLEALAESVPSAVMCAEGEWRRCHRRLIADVLVARGWRVRHIRPDRALEEHRLTPFAVVEGGRITYPPLQPTLEGGTAPPR